MPRKKRARAKFDTDAFIMNSITATKDMARDERRRRADPEGWSAKVTYLGPGKGYGCRVFHDGKLHSESKAGCRQAAAKELRDLLRWVDKLGNDSSMAERSRHRRKS